jgi:ubiquinone biosynthesis protein Coq4
MPQPTLDSFAERTALIKPTLIERIQLLGYCIRYLQIIGKQPERTECVYLLRAYADVLIPGHHLDRYNCPPELLTPISILKTLPEGSLGRLYADYMSPLLVDDAGLEIYQQKALEQEEPAGKALRERFLDVRYKHRNRAITDQHDLYHLVTGYDTSAVNEIFLQAFQFAQVGNGLAFIVGLGGITRPLKRGDLRGAWQVWLSFLRGKRAKLLLFTDWNEYWDRPIDEVRAALNL